MFLRKAEIFVGVSAEVLDRIQAMAEEEQVPEGHVFFRAGEPAAFLYVLKDGQVALTTVGAAPITFPIGEAGAVFGWSALVEPRTYTATCETTMPTTVIRLDGTQLLQMFEDNPQDGLLVLRRLAGVMASRLRASYERFAR
ncbi:cyclic nucleotide-binding protein [Desulfosoma caldarium]|uniref:Cyclic nucleotide-binding protein n=2 Tax=Desulfosoma caldarium TaxID=610254 RepID=A0A3N1UUS6_9BACT|nr:cyclic nucleotide-binding protein [Desulfosoma caldarium]